MKEEEMGEQARCALRAAAMVAAAGRKAGGQGAARSCSQFTPASSVVRSAGPSAGPSCITITRDASERAGGRDARYQRRGKSPSSLPSLSHAPLRQKGEAGGCQCQIATTPPLCAAFWNN